MPKQEHASPQQFQPNGLPAHGVMRDAALQYAALGLKIIPLNWLGPTGKCSCNDPGCRSEGKHPLYARSYLEGSTDPVQIKEWWKKRPVAGIGLVCGQPIPGEESKILIVLDVDPRNYLNDDDLADLQVRHGSLPDTAVQITGSGGFHYLFRAPKGQFKGYVEHYKGLEIKTKNHICVWPSRNKNGPYEWEGSSDPLEGQAISDCPEWLLKLVWTAPEAGHAIDLTESTGTVYVDPYRLEELRSALEHIDADDYHSWINTGMALSTIDEGAGFELWDTWSQRSAKYSAKACVTKWQSFNGGGRNLESIFKEALAYGWTPKPVFESVDLSDGDVEEAAPKADPEPSRGDVRPWGDGKPRPPKQEVPATGETQQDSIPNDVAKSVTDQVYRLKEDARLDAEYSQLQRAQMIVFEHEEEMRQAQPKPRYETFEPVEPSVGICPVQAVRDLTHWISAVSGVRSMEACQLAAIVTLATVASRRYKTVSGDNLNLFAALIADYVNDVSPLKNAIQKALDETGLDRLFIGQSCDSPMQFYTELVENPVVLRVETDHAGRLEFCRRQPSGLIRKVLALTAEHFDSPKIKLDGKQQLNLSQLEGRKLPGKPVIFEPCLNQLAVVAKNQTGPLFRGAEAAQGTVQQTIFYFTPDDTKGDPLSTPDRRLGLPGGLADLFAAIRPPTVDIGDDILLDPDASDHEPTCRIVALSTGIDFDEHYPRAEWDDERPTRSRLERNLCAAHASHLRKLASLLAICERPSSPTVDAGHIRWASQYLARSRAQILDAVAKAESDDGKQSVMQKILAFIEGKGKKGIGRGRLASDCWAFKNLSQEKRFDLLQTLIADRDIVEVESTKADRPPLLVSTKFVRRLDG
ncbi:MAG: bifunctional DNA primase/polymerase [Methylococcaceae bacterium]|nr:bifunctional DNA primase/polymerase [Methylococcaceae bacterium]